MALSETTSKRPYRGVFPVVLVPPLVREFANWALGRPSILSLSVMSVYAFYKVDPASVENDYLIQERSSHDRRMTRVRSILALVALAALAVLAVPSLTASARGTTLLTNGPASTLPSRSKREPWHGQSQLRSASL